MVTPFKTNNSHWIEFTSVNIYGAVTLYGRPHLLLEKKNSIPSKGDQRVLGGNCIQSPEINIRLWEMQ